MKKAILLLGILMGFFLYVQTGEAALTTNPSSITIPRGQQSINRITYRFTQPGGCFNAFSSGGQFISGQTVLGSVNTTLSVPLAGGAGRATETVVIPISVLKRAEQLKINRFYYRRIFSYSCVQFQPPRDISSVQINVTTEAAAEFNITRLHLYFENKRPEITVKRNQPSLKAYADIRFVGSGLLRGYWEVDGRILSYVNQHLVYGRSVTIESLDVPPLPTFVTGTHVVKFVVINPSPNFSLPAALYFVTAEDFREILPIQLIYPQNKSEIDFSPVTFRWERKDRMVTYLTEVFEEGIERPIFSAYSKKSDYTLPPSIFENQFSPDKKYLWRVRGFDGDNNMAGESSVFSFTFKELSSYVPGQIILVTEDSRKGHELIEEIRGKHNLRSIESYDIRSLHLKVAILYTEENIFKLMNAIMKEEGVILVQPNFIFRTMAEPMYEMQNIYKILNLKKLHETFKGRGVVVAVIDTGVDIQHRDLKDRVISSENLMKDYPYKAEIHGTAVAGVIGASINGFGIVGVAPESEILALRACRQISEVHPEGECYTSSIVQAIDRAIEKRAKIVNMSFGSISPDRLMIKLIEEGSRKGILFVAAVGNIVRQKDLTFPSSHPNVLSVAGMDDQGNPFPNREIASKARVCAPATNVLTTIPGDKHNFLSGTSMSSAVVAGIFAIAIGKDGEVDKNKIPLFRGDLCRWEEELLKTPICGNE